MKKLVYILNLFLLILLLNKQPLLAQSLEQFITYPVTEKNGLSDNKVNCFYEAPNGIIWIGTEHGLNSIDGSVVQSFHFPQAATTNSDNVKFIAGSNTDELWIASGSGLFTFQTATKKITRYYYSNSDSLYWNDMNGLCVTDTAVWIATAKGLLVWNSKKKYWKTLRIQHHELNYANCFNQIVRNGMHQFYLASYYGVCLFDATSNQFKVIDSPENDPCFDGFVKCIFRDHQQNLWFGSWSKGLKQYDESTGNIRCFSQQDNSPTCAAAIVEQQQTDGSTLLWISKNLTAYYPQSNTFKPLLAAVNPNLSADDVRTLFCDSHQLLWIATNRGIYIYDAKRQFFTHKKISNGATLSSQGGLLWVNQNDWYIGGQGEVSLQVLNETTQQITNRSSEINFTLLGVTYKPAVLGVTTDAQQNLWVNTSEGLLKQSGSTKKWQVYRHADQSQFTLYRNFVNLTLPTKKHGLVVATWRRGLQCLNQETNQFFPFPSKGRYAKKANVSNAFEEANGDIWFSDFDAGLIHYSAANDTFYPIVSPVRMTNIQNDGSFVWGVTDQLIYQVNKATHRIQQWKIPEGKNRCEYDFIQDKNNHLWIATQNGLLCFDKTSHQFNSFDQGDGLLADDMQGEFALAKNNSILFLNGTTITRFEPTIANFTPAPVPLLLRCITVDDSLYTLQQQSLVLSYDARMISIEWSLPQFSNPFANQYYYRLEGMDIKWQSTGNTGKVVFNSLAPGTYVFHYKAANSANQQRVEHSFKIIVRPPFWLTWWFILLVVIGFGVSVALLVRAISLRKVRKQLLQLEKERAVQNERNRISRDMHDELGSGLTKISILSEVAKTQLKNDDTSKKQLDTISQSSRELVSNLNEIIWTLNPKNDTLEALLTFIRSFAYKFTDDIALDCKIDFPQQVPAVIIKEELRRNLFLTIKELLNNCAKHAQATTITIKLQIEQNKLIWEIADNGIGFQEAGIRPFANGLTNMKQRIHVVGGTFTYETEPGKGTVFYIRVPFQ